MTIASNTTGTSSQTSGGAEQTQATINTAGVFGFVADLTLLANAATPDILIIRIYLQLVNAGTYFLADTHSYVGAQSSKFWPSKPYGSVYGIRLTLEQPQGTARAIPWAAWQYA